MNSNRSYGAIERQDTVESSPRKPSKTQSLSSYPSPGDNLDAKNPLHHQHSVLSLPTHLSDDEFSPGKTHKGKVKKRKRRKSTWNWFPDGRKQSMFVAPPYVFPPVGELEGEEHSRHKSHHDHLTDSGSSSDSSGSSEEEPLPPLTTGQILLICQLAFVNLCSTVVFSCIAPFFPSEAASKGATTTQIGFIFGIFELFIFIFAPLWGRYITQIGSKFMYCAGILCTGVTCVLFGFLNYSPNGPTYIGLCFAVRIAEAISDSAFMTASFAIVASSFPGRVSTIIGLLETFSGLGFTVGPPIGGALYEVGGFTLPFALLGAVLILAGLLAIPMIPKQDDKPKHHIGGVLGLLRYPAIVLFLSSIVICSISLTFIDPTLEKHLEPFNLSPTAVGGMFLAIGGVYTMTAPLWGYFVDRAPSSVEVMAFGAFVATIGMSFIGPAPFWGIKKTLWLVIISEVIIGVAVGALLIPTFHNTMTVALQKGYPEGFELYGLCSACFTACFSFGGFFGPTVFGGIVTETIGFEWTAFAIACLCFVVGCALLSYCIYQRIAKSPEDEIEKAKKANKGKLFVNEDDERRKLMEDSGIHTDKERLTSYG